MGTGIVAQSGGPTEPGPSEAPTPTPVPGGIVTDCDGVPADLCAATAAVAMAQGLVLESGQSLVGWVARPAELDCDDPLDAKVDFILEFARPAATLVLTIGMLPDGRLEVCSF